MITEHKTFSPEKYKRWMPTTMVVGDRHLYDAAIGQRDVICTLAKINVLAIGLGEGDFGIPSRTNLKRTVVVSGRITSTLYIETDAEKERERLEQQLVKLDKEIARSERLLTNEGFLMGAKPEVICRERDKLAGYRDERLAVCQALEKMTSVA